METCLLSEQIFHHEAAARGAAAGGGRGGDEHDFRQAQGAMCVSGMVMITICDKRESPIFVRGFG